MAAELESLAAAFATDHPGEAARELARLPPIQAAAYLEASGPTIGGSLARYLTAQELASVLEHFDHSVAASLLARLPPDLIAPALRRLDEGERGAILDRLPATQSRPVRVLLRYPEDCAGSWVEPRAVAVSMKLSAGKALEAIARAGDQVRYYVYVVDDDERLVGVADLRVLMSADADDRVEQLMNRDLQKVPARAGRDAVLRHPGWQFLHALPVVASDNTLVGILRHETVQALARSKPESSTGVSVPSALGDLYWTGSQQVLRELLGVLSKGGRP